METEGNPYEDPEFKIFREDLKQAKSDRLEVFKLYSTSSLAICSGLILCIGFMIKELHLYSYSWMLIVSAGFVSLALCFSLLELIISQFATVILENKLVNQYHDNEIEAIKSEEKLNKYAKNSSFLIVAVPFMIFIAMTVCLAFVFLNRNNFSIGDSAMSKDPKKGNQDMSLIVTSDAGKPKVGSRHIASIITDSAGKPKQILQPKETPKASESKPADPKKAQDKQD